MKSIHFLFRPLPVSLATAFLLFVPIARAQLALNLVSDSERTQIRQQTPQRTLVASQALDSEKSQRGLTGDDTFVAAASTLDEFGELHVRYIRKFRGVRVIGEGAKAVVNRAGAAAGVSRLQVLSAPPASVVPLITEAAALQTVANDLGAQLAELDSAQELAILPKGSGRAEARLVWSVNADAPDATATMYAIDALTGSILTKNAAHASNLDVTPGTGLSYFSGNLGITTRYSSTENKYKLQDTTRGDTLVYDVEDKKPTSSFHGNPFWSSVNTWGNGQDWQPGDATTGVKGQTAAVDAFYGGRRVWDTLKNVFGRVGLTDHNDPIKLRVHVRKKTNELYSDAYWDGYFANFGDGATPGSPHRADPDTVAHELGHGVWTHTVTSDPDDNIQEAGGLNEGHGDIMAAIVNHYFALADGQGSSVPTNGPEDVSLFNPRMVNPPEYDGGGVQGRPYYVNGMGGWEVHAQGCAYGRMFVTLAVGAPSAAAAAAMPACTGSRYSCLTSLYLPQGMGGIGIHKAAQIWYRATLKFPVRPTFASAREDFLEAAAELYGGTSDEYKSVMNAFHAINVGPEAVDTANPGISLGVPLVDEEEQSVRFSATGSDDIGVLYVEMSLPGTSKIVNRNPAVGYMNLAGSPYGQKDLVARAFDAMGNSAQTSREIAYTGANFVIDNRGFENGSADWNASSTNLVLNKASSAFLGSKYVGFTDSSYIRQQFTIPAGATNCRIGYRVRVNPKRGEAEPLLVELLSAIGASVQSTLNTIQPTADTTDTSSNHYKRYTHVLNDCAGQTRWIRFRTTVAPDGLYRLDNVFVTYTANPSGNFQVTVDEAERTVIFEMKNIQHIQPEAIDYVEMGSPGVTPWKDNYAPYLRIDSTSDFVLNATYYVKGAIVDHAGTKVYQSPTLPFIVHNVNQLLNNPGMESQGASWTNTGFAGWCPPMVVGVSASSFTGYGCGKFTGAGTIYQQVAIPNGSGQAQLTFRLRIQNGTSQQGLVAEIVNVNTGVVTELDTILGSENTYTGTTHNGYRKFTYNVSQFMGKTIRVRFRSVNSGGIPMEFYLDNVGLTYKFLAEAQ